MSMFAWMFGRQAELHQEVAQLKEQVESLRQVRADFNSLAAENARLEAELVRRKSMHGQVNVRLSSLSNECLEIKKRMQQMSDEIDTFQTMVVNR